MSSKALDLGLQPQSLVGLRAPERGMGPCLCLLLLILQGVCILRLHPLAPGLLAFRAPAKGAQPLCLKLLFQKARQ